MTTIKTSTAVWIILGFLFVLFIGFGAAIQMIDGSPGGSTLNPWLKSCGRSCQTALRTDRLAEIDKQTCVTLPEMYELPRTRNDLYWRQAISDKAASLGCPGFPKH